MRLSCAAVGAGAVGWLCGGACAEPPRYTAIDITEWSVGQLRTLPHFKRLVLVSPAYAPAGFTPVAASAAGHVVGFVEQVIPYTGNEAVLLRADASGAHSAEYIDPFGTYSWGYWSCDSTDCHYYFGYVRDSVPGDVNWAGTVVGRATVAGSGDYSSQAVYHAFLYDDGGRGDLFPDLGAATASCINNRGEIAGSLAGFGAYRRASDGTMTALDPVLTSTPSPRWINAAGVIIGSRYPSRAFVSPGGSATIDLPDLGGFETVTANDLNDTGWIVGKSGNFGDAETYATIWQPDPGGTWTEFDLVEQLDTPDVLLENAVAIDNAGNIIARGHVDGTDLFGSRTYWLVPGTQLPGWCIPDIGLHPSDATVAGPDAAFTVAVVNESDVTAYRWRRDGAMIDPAVNPSSATPTLVLQGLTGADSGAVFDCVITSDCGSAITDPATLTVAGCAADLTGDGVLSFFDLSAFLALFHAQDPAADLAEPFGVFNFFDAAAYVALYNAGCP